MDKTPQKYTFDVSFDGPRRNRKAEPAYNQAEMDAARTAAYAEGMAAGEQAAHQKSEQQQTRLLAALERRCTELLEMLRRQDTDRETALIGVGLELARKLLPRFIQRHGAGEIEAVFRQALGELGQESRLVVRVHDSELDTLRPQLENLATTVGFGGRLVWLADGELAPGDCRIEWADGGISHEQQQIWADADRAIVRAQGGNIQPSPNATPDPVPPATTIAI